MIRPIVCYGMPALRQKAQPMDPTDPELPQLVADLWDTMRAADGVGLAAPQIGVSKRVFVIDARPLQSPEDPPFEGVFINPEVMERSEETFIYEEGCLSIPSIREKVARPTSVRVRYWDLSGTLHEVTYEGIIGRIFQHEYDHLEGKLFIDYLPPLKRQLLRSKLSKIQKGLVETHYAILYAV